MRTIGAAMKSVGAGIIASCVLAAVCAAAPVGAQGGVTLTGTLLDANGEPLSGWAVISVEPHFPPPFTFTGDDGTFSFTRPSFDDVLAFDSGEWTFATTDPVTFVDDTDIEVRVPIDDLAVRVVDQSGDPIPFRTVSVSAEGVALEQELLPGAGPTRVLPPFNQAEARVTVDANGEGSFSAPVGDASGTIVLEAPYGQWDPIPYTFPLDRSTPLVYELGVVRSIDVEVLSSDGTPRPGVGITFEGAVSPDVRVVTDPSGSAVASLGRGPYRVSVRDGDATVTSEDGALELGDATAIRLTLPPLVSRRVVVVDGNGRPVDDARVTVRVDGTGSRELAAGQGPTATVLNTGGLTDSEGTVAIEFFEAEAYESSFRVSSPSGSNLLSSSVELDVDIDDLSCCTFEFRSLEGVVLDIDREPIGGVGIEVRPSSIGDPPGGATTSGIDGTFDLTFDAGTFDFIVRSGEPDERLPRDFEVTETAARFRNGSDVTFHLRGIDVPVTVVDHLGQPVDSAVIEACGATRDSPKFAAFREMEGSFCDGAVTDVVGDGVVTAFPTDLLTLDVTAPGRPDLEPGSAQIEVRYASTIEVVTIVLAPPTLTPGSVSVDEGDRWFRLVQIPVRLSSPASETVTARWEVFGLDGVPGVATPWVDLAGLSGRVIIREGDDTAHVPVLVFGDTVDEQPFLDGEWGLIRFSDVRGPALLDTDTFFGLGVVVIVDDDAAED